MDKGGTSEGEVHLASFAGNTLETLERLFGEAAYCRCEWNLLSPFNICTHYWSLHNLNRASLYVCSKAIASVHFRDRSCLPFKHGVKTDNESFGPIKESEIESGQGAEPGEQPWGQVRRGNRQEVLFLSHRIRNINLKWLEFLLVWNFKKLCEVS